MKNIFVKKPLFLLAFLTLFTACRGQSSHSRLEVLGQVVVPYNQSFKGTPIGGLSGLTYEPKSDTYYVISDDRSELANGRFYSFQLKLNEQGKLAKDSIRWKGVHFLKTPSGSQYPEGELDPEGIAVDSDSLIYVSSEGAPDIDIAPFINAYKKDGEFFKALTIPPAYWPSAEQMRGKEGVRVNLGFEGLAVSPDGRRLYAGTENALLQDGPAADSMNSSPSRIIVYELPSGKVLHEYRYDVSPVHIMPGDHGDFSVNGLTDLVALNNDGHLLSIDRNYVDGQGIHINLYEVFTKGATDIQGMETMKNLKQKPKSVHKKLLAHLGDFGITLDNFEGLVLGPELENGKKLVLIVSDNNFSSDQETIFTAFALQL